MHRPRAASPRSRHVVSRRVARRAPLLALVALLAPLVLTGCPAEYGEPWVPEPWPEPATTGAAPRIDDVRLPTWPPLGPEGSIEVVGSTDGADLTRLTTTFRQRDTFTTSGKDATIVVPAKRLGEGFGTLDLELTDREGRWSRRAVEDLLVDLSPPRVEIERAVVSPLAGDVEGDVAFVVRDAFVLGSVEVTFRGQTFTHEFPKAYPSTLGQAWDVSRVTFPAKDFVEGTGVAIVVVRDAAGNATTESFQLKVDATPPSVAITSPAPGATLSGPFDVALAGTDPDGAADVTFDVFVNGSPVATLLGPLARVTLDPATLPRGPLEIRAVARDEAGNLSEAARVAVTLQ